LGAKLNVRCFRLATVPRHECRLPAKSWCTAREFYDFEAKYRDEDSVELIVPAVMAEASTSRNADDSGPCLQRFRRYGLGRVDFFLTPDGFVVNEINTMPGFTPLSMYPKLWQASGLGYADLIDELIELALVRA
jgi:D-alanine-D-alanine ligase